MQDNIVKVNPEFVYEKMQAGLPLHLIDVRSVNEFNKEHVKDAKLFSMDEINAQKLQTELGKAAGTDEPLYLMCTAGFRAEQAAKQLQTEGMDHLFVINGGINAWNELDLPTKKTKQISWSVNLPPQAQAQMFMGLLILLFATKGVLLHPVFTVIVGFVGLIMLISSIDQRFCLARVFSDMPWNKA